MTTTMLSHQGSRVRICVRFALAASCSFALPACQKQTPKIESPDPHARKDSGQTVATSEDANEAAPKDPDSVCSEAKAVAAIAPSDIPRELVSGRATIAVLGFVAGDKYTLADLQALEKKEQYEELLLHIEDVAPASRSAAWDALLTRASTAYVATLTDIADTYGAFGGFMTTEQLAKRYPQLRKSKEFMRKRGEVGKHMFEKCFQLTYSGEECVGMALEFVKVAGTDAGEKLAVAKVVSRNQNKYVAVPFFTAALKDDKSGCKDADLAATTTAGLALPPDYDNAKGARDIAQNVCFAELEKPIVEALTKSDTSGYYRDNACAVLREKGVVK
jgi:hypothetical protein